MTTLIEKVNIPAGKLGEAEISHFVVEELDFIARFHYGSRAPQPGSYTRLTVGGELMMTDTTAEMRDHLYAVKMAKDHCLVTGLGLGMVANAMARKEEVTRVTVLELSPDVEALVSASLHPKVEVIIADALEYRPAKGLRFGAVWHDIWPSICEDNLEQMTILKKRYARRTDWQGCWCENECRRERRETRSRQWRW